MITVSNGTFLIVLLYALGRYIMTPLIFASLFVAFVMRLSFGYRAAVVHNAAAIILRNISTATLAMLL